MKKKLHNKLRWVFGSERIEKLFKSIITLITGNGLAMIMGFFSQAILVNMVGLSTFGNVTLIVSYVQVIDSIVNFQSWQALIKYGATYKNDELHLKPYLKEAFIVDASTSILGTFVAILFADIVCGTFLGWSKELVNLVKMYSFTILFHLEGMAIGYLRIMDKFKQLSICTVVISIVKFFMILIAYYIRRDIYMCVLIYALTDILVYLSQLFIALYDMKKKNLLHGIIKCKMPEFTKFFSFSMYTSLATTLDIPIKQLDVFIISRVLSVEAVAVQKIFNTLLNIFNKVTVPISQVVYPSFSTQIGENKVTESIHDVKKISKLIFVAGVPIAFVIGITSPIWLKILYSVEVATYWKVFLIEAIFRVCSLSFIAVHPLFTAMGFVKQNIPIMAVSNMIYFILSIALGMIFGLYGIAIAYLVQLIIVVTLKYKYIKSFLIDHLSQEQ